MNILNVENLTFSYAGCDKRIFNQVSFAADEGEILLICGGTASGKTTLLKCLKPELSPYGQISGKIMFMGNNIENVSSNLTTAVIGYVMQRPENQTVTHKVKNELAFCGENIGLSDAEIKRQIAETAAYFGLEALLEQETSTLSGGQRQLLNLAAVLTVKPKLILLDEPTSQLDPVAAGNFIGTLQRITNELGITVIIAEHRFEQLLPIVDRILMLKSDMQAVYGSVKEIADKMISSSEISQSLPSWMRLYGQFRCKFNSSVPITLSDGRNFIENNIKNDIKELKRTDCLMNKEIAVKLKDICFAYEKNKNDVLNGVTLNIRSQSIFMIMGSNGSGKSTLLSVISGILKPYRGKITIDGKCIDKCKAFGSISLLPQDVQTSFFCDTVKEELNGNLKSDIYDFSLYADTHPYDLSGGQQQLLAIEKLVNSNKSGIFLLDEPTKGLDGKMRQIIAEVVQKLKHSGKTVIAVTHDMEFAAMCADECGLLFNGEIISVDTPQNFFSSNLYYTTSAAKVSCNSYNGICNTDDLIKICHINGLKGVQ